MSEQATPAAPAAEAATQAAPEAQENALESAQSLEGAESQEQTEAKIDANPKLTKTQKQEIKKNLKKLKLKVDGREFEEEIDLNDTDYITKQLQLAKAAQKRMGEYSQLEKEVKTFIEQLRKDPKKVLRDPNIGVDIKNLARQIIEEEIENSKKSPEQLAKEKLEQELKDLKAQQEKEREEFKQKELQRLQEIEYERYDTLMSKALEASELPKTPYVVKKMADYMLTGLQNGVDITPEDVLPLVKEEMQNDLKEMFAIMPEEVIEQFIGKDVFNKVRKKNLAKAKAAPPVPIKSAIKDVGAKTGPKEEKPVTKKTIKELFGV